MFDLDERLLLHDIRKAGMKESIMKSLRSRKKMPESHGLLGLLESICTSSSRRGSMQSDCEFCERTASHQINRITKHTPGQCVCSKPAVDCHTRRDGSRVS